MKTATAALLFLSLAGSCHGWLNRRPSTSCTKPSGRDCSWYEDCLEKQFPCEGNTYDYSIGFAKKFCNLFGKNYNTFSSTSKRWIDATRKCLQKELAPILTSSYIKFLPKYRQCRLIYYRGFASHTKCYVKPESGSSLTICNLPDKLKILNVIKGAFLQDFRAVSKQSGEVVLECAKLKLAQLRSKWSQWGK